MDTLLDYIFIFFFYSNVGWFFESLYCSAPVKRWINRGFLTGPICPIYGAGAIVMDVFLAPLSGRWYLVYFGGMVLCDIVELVTGIILDKLFNQRWWDYSGKFMNYKGYICLKHTFIWGGVALFNVKLMHPFFKSGFALIPDIYRNIILGIILTVFVFDLADAVLTSVKTKRKLKNNA